MVSRGWPKGIPKLILWDRLQPQERMETMKANGATFSEIDSNTSEPSGRGKQYEAVHRRPTPVVSLKVKALLPKSSTAC